MHCNILSDYLDFCCFRAMTQQLILHLVVNLGGLDHKYLLFYC